MFDTIDMALEQFSTLRENAQAGHATTTDAWIAWLKSDAMHAVDDLAMRPDFREQVCWSLDHLTPGSRTTERQHVEEIDSAIVSLASRLTGLAMDDGLRESLLCVATAAMPQGVVVHCAEQQSGLGTLHWMAQRPWKDLVSDADFWGPSSGLNLKPECRAVENPVEFIPMLHRELRQPGDHIAGLLFRRLDYWLVNFRTLVPLWTTALRNCGDQGSANEIARSVVTLTKQVEAFESAVMRSPRARARNACLTLFQIYRELCPVADLRWIGNRVSDASLPLPCFVSFWLRSHGEKLIASKVASALNTASAMYRRRLNTNEVIQEAKRSHRLVVIQGLGTRFAFWDGTPIEGFEGSPQLWETLWALALKTKWSQGLDHDDFGCDSKRKPNCNQHGLACRMNRLEPLLPKELRDRIRCYEGVYLLNVLPVDIYLAEAFETGVHIIDERSNFIEARQTLYQAGLAFEC